MLTRIINRFLFQKKTSYTFLIQSLTDKLSRIKDPRVLAEAIVTFLTDPEKSSYYDTENRLKRVAFKDGKTIAYIGGVISKITEADLSRYIFDIKTNLDGSIISNLTQYVAPDGAIYRYEEGAISQVAGSKLEIVSILYNAERRVKEIHEITPKSLLIDYNKLHILCSVNSCSTWYILNKCNFPKIIPVS